MAATLLLSPISTMLMVVALNMAISVKRPRRASLKGSLCCLGCGHSESPRMGLNRTKIANNAEQLDLQRCAADSVRETTISPPQVEPAPQSPYPTCCGVCTPEALINSTSCPEVYLNAADGP
ncbi:hypothetical protein OIDMADRAFT_19227 [Oidiodendron maius Zn]|uniref:Uncharacterized protein n=1 Tax=Oidiodendron maius (strain Zn) TaxID=913774 RepID=A0A0C3HDR0_OIDMZ|nr:hypothetical protein OIDMADRAFT_19227 [Oidiodendron maius Zn]